MYDSVLDVGTYVEMYMVLDRCVYRDYIFYVIMTSGVMFEYTAINISVSILH